jgi:uncharacterized protein (DUF58 family)
VNAGAADDGALIDPSFGFDDAFLRRLEQLALRSRRPVVGPRAGPRRSPQHGSSVEFADFRQYLPGDDFRRIDWNAYARLDRLFLHLFSAEQMTSLTLFLDHSRSMGFGEPPKALASGRLAAILAYIALHRYDRVKVVGWARAVDCELPVRGGKGAIASTWKGIADVMSARDGNTDFDALRDYCRRRRDPGLVIVLSDFLTDSNWQGGLHALQASGKEVSVVQVLAPDELQPEMRGDWALVDAENGARVEVTVSPGLLRRYAEELASHTAALRDYCGQQGMGFVQISSAAICGDRWIEDGVLTLLREAGMVG